MSNNSSIHDYYEKLAPYYDQDRFENSYGSYIDAQERKLLSKWLQNTNPNACLDLACGTGRLLDFAKTGADFSQKMLDVAQQKWEDRKLIQSDISKLPFENNQFEAVYSMHVIMHLEPELIQQALNEVHRIIKPGGFFIFDFPNLKRRKAINYQKSGWHGNTALSISNIQNWIKEKWILNKEAGFMLFPVHRIPVQLRTVAQPLDSFLLKTPLRHWASYHCVCLQKLD